MLNSVRWHRDTFARPVHGSLILGGPQHIVPVNCWQPPRATLATKIACASTARFGGDMALRFSPGGAFGICMLSTVAGMPAAHADDFYRGKAVQVYVGFSPGGGY